MLWTTQLERKRTWGSWWTPDLNVSQQGVLTAKKESSILGCIRQSMTWWVRWSFPFYTAPVRPHLESCVCFWISVQERSGDILERAQEAHQSSWGVCSISLMRKGRDSWDCLAWRRERGILKSINTWRKAAERTESGFFSVVLSARTRSSGHKLKYRRFPLNVKTHLLNTRMTESWHMWPRWVVKSPSLVMLRSCLNKVLGVWYRWHCLSEIGPSMTSRGPFQSLPFCNFDWNDVSSCLSSLVLFYLCITTQGCWIDLKKINF